MPRGPTGVGDCQLGFKERGHRATTSHKTRDCVASGSFSSGVSVSGSRPRGIANLLRRACPRRRRRFAPLEAATSAKGLMPSAGKTDRRRWPGGTPAPMWCNHDQRRRALMRRGEWRACLRGESDYQVCTAGSHCAASLTAPARIGLRKAAARWYPIDTSGCSPSSTASLR